MELSDIWGYVEDGYDAFTNLFGDDALTPAKEIFQ